MVYLNMKNNEWILALNPFNTFKSVKTSPLQLQNEHRYIAEKMGIPSEIVKRHSVRAYISEVFRLRNKEAWSENPLTDDTEMHFIELR